MNPHYDYEKLELDMLCFDEPDMSYEFNMLCFWKTKTGEIYSASDSGCSCPTPFEDYFGETQKDVFNCFNVLVHWNRQSRYLTLGIKTIKVVRILGLIVKRNYKIGMLNNTSQ